MEISWRRDGRVRHYDLVLDSIDLEELFRSQGTPLLSPFADDGSRFWIYPCLTSFDRRFLPHPEDGYYIYVNSERCGSVEELADLFRRKGQRVPIEMDFSEREEGKTINLGYVSIGLKN